MLKLLKTIFGGSSEKKANDVSPDNKNTETKKCLNCLRRVNVDYSKCPHCRKEDFQY